jgi:hypothetical protein
MGRDKAGLYILDNNAFVKKLKSKKDRRKVDELARRISNGECPI